MGWIKRNLFFVVGGVVSLALLGGAGFYIYSQWSRNNAANDKLTEIYGSLTTVAQQQPGPGNEKVNNTQTAKDQDQQLRAWINSTTTYFHPIPGIPPGTNISSKDYAAALSRTIDQLQRAADNNGVLLPPKYGFSFEAQRSLMKFASGSLDLLAGQLGEVKAIADILFATRINALDSIQRVRVSDDDAQGSADYIDERPLTNDLAVMTPYVITFRCFTPELARVIAGFSTASNTMIIKSINVTPAGTTGAASQELTPDIQTGGAPPIQFPGRFLPGRYPSPTEVQTPSAQAPVGGKGGLQTVLKEQLLRIVMEVEIVKLAPKS